MENFNQNRPAISEQAIENFINAAAEGSEVDKLMRGCRVDMTEGCADPNFLLNMWGVGFLPFGSLCVVCGQAKQGKSQFVNILASVIMSGQRFGELCRGYAPGGGVLWIDTEQGVYNIHKNIQRLAHLCGYDDAADTGQYGLNVYETAPLTPEQRIEIINAAIEKHAPGILVIDGIRDLLYNFNDEKESIALVSWLMQLQARGDMTIICVIHTNEGTNKMRGHLGSELANKVCDRFMVCRQDRHFNVDHISRNDTISRLSFHFDADGNLRPWADDAPDNKGRK